MSRRLPVLLALAAGAALAPCASAASGPHWLCRPGLASDPCTPGLSTTQVSPSGEVLGTTNPKRVAKPNFDCFYVYPTVSDQKTPQATFRVDPEERSIALYQAARYSQHCRVYAPMYRQVTLTGLLKPETVTTAMRRQGYTDVRDAWRSYLKHDNKGRGVVLIGHSQGSYVLRRLVHDEIDPRATARRRLISAVLLGGNVTVKKGSDRGGDFKNVRACRGAAQVGCVIAFSTFNATPPPDAKFGRVGGRGLTAVVPVAGSEILCTNPAALGGGAAKLDTIQPAAPFAPRTTLGAIVPTIGLTLPAVKTSWIEAKGAYTASCSRAGGANVLRIRANDGAPVLKPSPDATWGLHLVDANIALGDLVAVVAKQAAAYARGR